MEYIREALHVVCGVCLHRVRGNYELCHRSRILRRIWVCWILRGRLPRFYMNLGVLEPFFWHFRFQGLGFGVTSGLGLGVLTLPFLGLLSQSRVIWVISPGLRVSIGVFPGISGSLFV